jgi:hypothetical protein
LKRTLLYKPSTEDRPLDRALLAKAIHDRSDANSANDSGEESHKRHTEVVTILLASAAGLIVWLCNLKAPTDGTGTFSLYRSFGVMTAGISYLFGIAVKMSVRRQRGLFSLHLIAFTGALAWAGVLFEREPKSFQVFSVSIDQPIIVRLDPGQGSPLRVATTVELTPETQINLRAGNSQPIDSYDYSEQLALLVKSMNDNRSSLELSLTHLNSSVESVAQSVDRSVVATSAGLERLDESLAEVRAALITVADEVARTKDAVKALRPSRHVGTTGLAQQ